MCTLAVVEMRLRSVSFIVLLLSYLVLLPVMVRSDELDVIEVENPVDLLSHVTAMDMMLEDYEGNEAFFGYEIVGEEKVRGADAWIVHWNYSTTGSEEMSEFMLWISKNDGKIVQVEIEGQKITDSTLTAPFANVTFGFLTMVVIQSWNTWDYNELQNLSYGEVTPIGNGTEQYGPTTLQVFKYQFAGEETAPEQYRHMVEAWTAPTPFGSIVTYLYVESITDDKWFSWEVESIELAETQKTTEETPSTEKEEPEEKEEEELVEEPINKTGEQERKGIPGFPFEATLIGILAGILFMSTHKRRIGINIRAQFVINMR